MNYIKNYLLIKDYKEFANILRTKESRVKYLCSQKGINAKLKDEEIEILVNTYFFNKNWLINGTGEKINYTAKENHEIIQEFQRLSPERKKYYLLTIKAENTAAK